jgi:hypothetical protein
MFRRALAFLVAGAMLFAVLGCGGDKNPKLDKTDQKPVEKKESQAFTPD